MSWASFLLGMAGPLVARALLWLGVSGLAIVGVRACFDAAVSVLQSHYLTLPADALLLAGLAGVPQGMGMVLGGYLARITLWIKLNGVKWIKG